MKTICTLVLLIFCINTWALDPNHFTITRISAPYFIVDGNSPATLTQAYVGFEIRNNSNSGVTYAGLRFTITSIGTSVAGQNYAVVSPVGGVINVGTLAPGESRVCYYYVSYPASVTPQATFNVQLSDQTASAKTQSIVIRNRSSISANAGGTATQTFTNQDLIGGIIIDDVTYVVGNVQNGDENDFQVAVSSQFDPAKITLLSTQVIASNVPGVNVGATDSLHFITGNGSTGATITMRWTFRITGYNFTTYLLPCAGATSGSTNYKYALNTSLGSGTPVTVSAAANPLTIAKTSDKSMYKTNSGAVFTITIQNPGAHGVTIDRITDQLPTGFVFQSFHATSQVTAANSTSVPVAGATGNISFEGGVASGGNTSYYIPAGGSLVVMYNATTAAVSAANLVTTAADYIGTTQVGTAQNTVSVSATLPVNLLSFKVGKVNGGTMLTWATSREINSSFFEVERSGRDGQFASIGKLAAAGASAGNINYSFIDSFPVAGTNYYRLKMIDQDLQYQYSHVIAYTPGNHELNIKAAYPNPFGDYMKVTVVADKDGPLNLELYDVNGRLVLKRNITARKGENLIILDQLGHLQRGNYLLKAGVASMLVYKAGL
ncbi:MAG TPA: T9SS type A sorting domain-containing protein [Chitinophagaceae bacterium]|nr:T9SS type A sorting domain-containing protein [Chitinophagaceae bacterium]